MQHVPVQSGKKVILRCIKDAARNYYCNSTRLIELCHEISILLPGSAIFCNYYNGCMHIFYTLLEKLVEKIDISIVSH
jgi:hypothetical protein